MGSGVAALAGAEFYPDPGERVFDSIFKQYERVILESLVTSFGLDFLIQDKHGGDVDTIHNVRQIGRDGRMAYKNAANETAYAGHGDYDSQVYHSDKGYIDKNREISRQKDAGVLTDAYTGERVARNARTHLDHVISAKEIHDDRGRVLAGLKGTDLANSGENLQATNPHTNQTKQADSMERFLERRGQEYSQEQKDTMRQIDAAARKSYEAKLATAYYTGPQFRKDLAAAAANVSVRMGIRQVYGFVFAEVWFAVKEEFSKVDDRFDLGELLAAIGRGIKRGFQNTRSEYKDLLGRFGGGAAAGALASVTTTISNIFFTTSKNVVRIIRQAYASVVLAAQVLFVNPDGLEFGDRMRAIVKLLSVGASVVVGTAVSDAIGKTPVNAIPLVGDAVQVFGGTLVSGIMSCSFLLFLDRSEIMNRLVGALNGLHTTSTELNYFRRQAAYFERYAAELMEIDYGKFCEETAVCRSVAERLEGVESEEELNTLLRSALDKIGVKIPWEEDFDTFMSQADTHLVYE